MFTVKLMFLSCLLRNPGFSVAILAPNAGQEQTWGRAYGEGEEGVMGGDQTGAGVAMSAEGGGRWTNCKQTGTLTAGWRRKAS